MKPSNILIDKLCGVIDIVKIGDFSYSKFDLNDIKNTIKNSMGVQSSSAYIAPEILCN